MSDMYDPPHPGEIIRDAIDAAGWTCGEATSRIGCTPGTLSRILNGHAGISPRMALALEGIGWSNANYWSRMQSAYDVEKARHDLDRGRRRQRSKNQG